MDSTVRFQSTTRATFRSAASTDAVLRRIAERYRFQPAALIRDTLGRFATPVGRRASAREFKAVCTEVSCTTRAVLHSGLQRSRHAVLTWRTAPQLTWEVTEDDALTLLQHYSDPDDKEKHAMQRLLDVDRIVQDASRIVAQVRAGDSSDSFNC